VDWGEDFRIFDDKLFLLKIGKERESFLRECKEKLERILDVLDGKEEDKGVERDRARRTRDNVNKAERARKEKRDERGR
jgi:hypothetical protein